MTPDNSTLRAGEPLNGRNGDICIRWTQRQIPRGSGKHKMLIYLSRARFKVRIGAIY
jgi:hypothetical protein